MKKYFISGVLAIAISAVFTGCSKSTDLYDEGAQQQAKAQAEIAKKFATYESDYVKAFGAVAPGHKWGFDQTAGRNFTRLSLDKTSEAWIVPDNFKNARIVKEGNAANALEDAFNTNLPQTFEGFNFNNYWLQHVEMPKNVKVSIISLEAYNSKDGKWEKVLNFDGGKNETDFQFLSDEDELDANPITAESTNFITGVNKSVPCATLMTNMGGSGDPNNNNKLFRVYQATKHGNRYTYSYNYDYYFLTGFEYYKNSAQNISGDFLGFHFTANNGKSSFWCIKIAEAQKEENPVLAEGRVFCEDMGANDFDFNDVVFDATIMRTGEIKIKVLAHGGILPISVAGVNVTLADMSNTGLKVVPTQDINITADVAKANNWTTIDAIPVVVNPNTEAETYVLGASQFGSAPQKICAPVGTLWPLEYTRIDEAYSPFTTWSNIADPQEWTAKMNQDKVYQYIE